jgi:GAF domain-containing protein
MRGNYRSALGIPLLRKGETIGVFVLTRPDMRPYTDKQIELVKTFADQAVIAIENVRLFDELRESLQQQTATADVLKVISSTPGDLQPVFDTMLAKATDLCQASYGTMWLSQADGFRTVAMYGGLPPAWVEQWRSGTPYRPLPNRPLARVAESRQPIQITDLRDDQSYLEGDPLPVAAVEIAGIRTLLVVPMFKESELVGAIAIYRKEVRPFTDKQIALVTNFAAQAVIAIENTRLLSELRESLQQQTATADVLKVISSSAGELQPVFEAVLENATRLCAAKFGTLYLCEGGAFRTTAMHNVPPAFAEVRRRDPLIHPEPGSLLRRLVDSKKPVHIPDVTVERAYIERQPRHVTAVELGGFRSILGVPMLKDRSVVGAIVIYRQEISTFFDKQIELVQNFAAQAVIAIENTRLLNELRESLQQQTATADVLKVISRSTFDLQTVLDTLVESAARLCGAEMANIWRPRDGAYRLTASYGVTARYKESLENKEFLNTIAIEPGRGTTVGRVLLERKSVHIHDIQADPDYKLSGLVALGGTRTMLGIPMLREGDPIGVLVLVQSAVRPFTDKQIELATTFADQAVIAIENVRLFEEVQARTRDLSESLEQQTATSEVLQVISSSAGELKPVFETMLESAVRICGAKFGNLLLVEGDAFRHVALHGAPQAYLEERRREPVIRPRPGSDLDRIRSTKQIVHVADMQLGGPATAAIVELAGARTFLNVPMLKDNELMGTIGIYRQEVRPFTNKQIELVQNFAAQAVIAIENARLLNDLNKLNQQLEQRVDDQVNEIERMSRLRRFLPPQVADLIVTSGTEKQLESHRREITALFCDLRGFTGFSESSDPEDVMALLREYHAAIGEIINK